MYGFGIAPTPDLKNVFWGISFTNNFTAPRLGVIIRKITKRSILRTMLSVVIYQRSTTGKVEIHLALNNESCSRL